MADVTKPVPKAIKDDPEYVEAWSKMRLMAAGVTGINDRVAKAYMKQRENKVAHDTSKNYASQVRTGYRKNWDVLMIFFDELQHVQNFKNRIKEMA